MKALMAYLKLSEKPHKDINIYLDDISAFGSDYTITQLPRNRIQTDRSCIVFEALEEFRLGGKTHFVK